MAYTSSNPNGQSTGANSSPVVIASDQSTVKVKLSNDITNTTGSITTATSTVTTGALAGVGSLTISISGTYAGVAVTFEASMDNTTWVSFAVQQIGVVAPTVLVNSGALTTNSTNLWNASPVLGLQYFRVRATTWTSGSASVVIAPSAQFTQYLSNISTMPVVSVTGTVTSNMTATTNFIGVNPTTSVSGLLMYSNISVTNTALSIKASAARMYEYDFYNPNTSGVWVQLFNKLFASITVGTTIPDRTIYIPPSAGRDWTSPYSAAWSTGLCIACTTTSTGGTAPATAIYGYMGYI